MESQPAHPNEVHADAKRDGSAALGLSVLLVVFTMVGSWAYSLHWPADDLFLHSCVAKEIGNPSVGDIYSEEGRAKLGAINARRSAVPGAPSQLRTLHERYPHPTTVATPFLYTCWSIFDSEDYVESHRAYCLLQLACTAFGVLSFAYFFGFALHYGLLALAMFTWPFFEPFLSVSRTCNVSQLQLAMLAVYLWTQAPSTLAGVRRRGWDIAGGAVLGLAVAFKPNVLMAVLLVLLVRALDKDFRSLLHTCVAMLVSVGVAIIVSSAMFADPHPWTSWLNNALAFLSQPPALRQGNLATETIVSDWLGFESSLPLLVLFGGLAVFTLWRWRSRFSSKSQDAVAVALGLLVSLLSASVVWLHYYNLAVPLVLFCLRPAVGTLGHVRVGVACALVFAMALQPFQQLAWATTWSSHGSWLAGCTAGLFLLACVTIERRS